MYSYVAFTWLQLRDCESLWFFQCAFMFCLHDLLSFQCSAGPSAIKQLFWCVHRNAFFTRNTRNWLEALNLGYAARKCSHSKFVCVSHHSSPATSCTNSWSPQMTMVALLRASGAPKPPFGLKGPEVCLWREVTHLRPVMFSRSSSRVMKSWTGIGMYWVYSYIGIVLVFGSRGLGLPVDMG